jgi:light-regulated signal transduction histidine kinase (bacteriophytochrome)
MREPGAFGADRSGMTVRRKIVERHGGKIRLETEPGKGSRFFLRLRRFAKGGRPSAVGARLRRTEQ